MRMVIGEFKKSSNFLSDFLVGHTGINIKVSFKANLKLLVVH